MTNQKYTYAESSVNIPSILSRVSFFIFLCIVIFGITYPYTETTDVEDIITSSPINQILFSSLYFLSLIGLWPKIPLVLRFIKKEKFLSLFLLWTFFSIFWSDDPFVSFKRWIQFFGTVIIILSAIAHFSSADDVLRYLKLILYIFLPLNLLSILFVPEAIQSQFQAWRGITPHKNTLGQASLISLIIWTCVFYQSDIKNKLIPAIFAGLSLILMTGARSSTATIALAFLLIIFALLMLDKHIFRPVVGPFISSLVISAMIIGLIPIIYLGMGLFESAIGLMGKDLTFSGRVDLWSSIFDDAKTHLIIGCGYGGFWMVGSEPIEALYDLHVWLPNQAHMGYLDTLNETGIIGIVILAFMIIYYFSNLSKIESPHFWKWFVIAALVINTMESSLISYSRNISNTLFIYAYVALYIELIQPDEERPEWN